jgi:beta-lactamase class A
MSLAAPATAWADDQDLLRAVADLPAVDAAAQGARSGSPDAVQRLYDRARDLAEDLRAAEPVSGSCRSLWRTAAATTTGHVRAAEGIDRLSPGAAAQGRAMAAANARKIPATRRACRPASVVLRHVAEFITPRSDEAFFGTVRARTPRGATTAELWADGVTVARVDVAGPEVRVETSLPPRRHDLEIVFRDAGGAITETAVATDVWPLPAAARSAHDGVTASGDASRRLADIGGAFPGYTGLWVQDLTSGRTASYNADARFPAASTVKLALLIGALAREGASAEGSRDRYDLRAMAGWSSNLATNRILARMGGSALAQRVMQRVGATRSTFTGGYIVGTSFPGSATTRGTAEPPATSSRVTTARDMARLLFTLHAAATGRRDALNATGLTLHQARIGLAMLLDSEQRGDNRSLVAGAAPAGTPIAQKNGWIRRARHGAAIIYGPDGPRIVVALTYSEAGVSLEQARRTATAAARITP